MRACSTPMAASFTCKSFDRLKESVQIIQWAREMSDDIDKIEYLSPNPIYLSKSDVFYIAERISKQLSYPSTKNILSVVNKLGGYISYIDFWKSERHTGSLVVERNGKFRILVPKHTSMQRDRFTIAHELGHYFLHYMMKLTPAERSNVAFQADRYEGGRVEWEANWFAAAFLMPEKEFRTVYKKSGSNFFSIASHFHVSTRAAITRAKSLEIQ